MTPPRPLQPGLDAAASAARLRLSTTRLARRLRQEAGTELTMSMLSALAVLEHHGPMTLGALAEHEQVAPPSITRIVHRLEAEGLVTRSPDEIDRRVTWVALSDPGRSLVEESRRRKTAWLTDRISSLDEHAQERLAAALDVLEELTR